MLDMVWFYLSYLVQGYSVVKVIGYKGASPNVVITYLVLTFSNYKRNVYNIFDLSKQIIATMIEILLITDGLLLMENCHLLIWPPSFKCLFPCSSHVPGLLWHLYFQHQPVHLLPIDLHLVHPYILPQSGSLCMLSGYCLNASWICKFITKHHTTICYSNSNPLFS